MFIKLLETLNNKKNFPYFFVSIFPYAIGDIFEQIQYALLDSSKKKKKINFTYSNNFSKIIKVQSC